ncbi:hypothetical protein [Caldimonas brevitalea]|uniref:LysM domain-containing protein n=1 Tax=Caldimonas brevitalea TaxID=413882 RepID=A0A0G3BVL8_9BURK|nr:hypothetical protein [Caldimonas brevitalea]AKJ32073.1 hypothetical protein AAW51_5382 [Caldimonas brevitalea]
MTAPTVGPGSPLHNPSDPAAKLNAALEAARAAAAEARRQAEEARRKAEQAREQAELARKNAKAAADKARDTGKPEDQTEATRLEGVARDKELAAAKLQAQAVLKEKEQKLAQSKLDDLTRRGPTVPSQATRTAQTEVEQARASVAFYENPEQPVLTQPIDHREFGQVRGGEGLEDFARRHHLTRDQVLALNPQFDPATANGLPGSPAPVAHKRDADGLEVNEWLRVQPDALEAPAVARPRAPDLPTAFDVNHNKVDGKTLHEATMASLLEQYANAPAGSDQRRFAMLLRAQGATQNGVQLDDKNYREDMPVDVVTGGIIDKQKVASELQKLSGKPEFAQRLAADYQKELNAQFPKFFPNQGAGSDNRNVLWAGLTHGEGNAYPAYKQSDLGGTGPLWSGGLPVSQGGPSFTAGDISRGNSLIATVAVPGYAPPAGPTAGGYPLFGKPDGQWLQNVQKSVPGSAPVVDPITRDLSYQVLGDLKQRAGQSGGQNGFTAFPALQPDEVSLAKLDAKLAADHPELNEQQRADVIGQTYELLGISDRQAKQYAAAAAPYLEVRKVKLEGNDQYDPKYTQNPPQYVTLKKDAPQSAVDAWKALQNATAMRGSLDDVPGLTLDHKQPPPKANPALATLGSDDFTKAVNGSLDAKTSPQSIAQRYADYMTSPDYLKYLESLPSDQVNDQVHKDLLNIQAFDAGIATRTADQLGNRIFETTYADVRPSETDDDKGQAATYTAWNVLRWSIRTTGLLAGTDAENWKAAGDLFKLVKKVDAQGGNTGDLQQIEKEIQRQQSAGEITADEAKTTWTRVQNINKAGGWASFAGLINAGVANDKLDSAEFRQKLMQGDVDTWMVTLNHLDIGLSYGEHYLRVVARAQSKVPAESPLAKAIGLYKGDFADVISDVRESLRPTMGEMSDALKGVDLSDPAAVKKALNDNLNAKRTRFAGIVYDNDKLAQKISQAAGDLKLTPAEITSLKHSADARLGFLSMTTGELGTTPLGESIAKQSKALVGVDLSDAKAVQQALKTAGFGAQSAEFISERIANTHTSGNPVRGGDRFEVYGKLLNETYGQAPTGYSRGLSAASKVGDAAVLGTLSRPPGAAHTASDAGRGMRYVGVPLKGAIALLDVAAGPLSGYFAYQTIQQGIKTDNTGFIIAGSAEALGAVAFTAGGLAELGILAGGSAAAGPFFIAGFVLTAAGLAIYELSQPSALEQNTTSLQDYFRTFQDAGPGVLKDGWEGEVKDWSDTNQTRSPRIMAPGPLDGRPHEPASEGVA